MTDFRAKPQPGTIVKLNGIITGYKCTRSSASFVYSHNDQKNMGVVAVAAALAGMGGQAASIASHVSDLEEPAEYLEFALNNDLVKGWVWRSPFKEGDVVEVAAEWQSDHYEAYGISRPADRMIALYPHCSRSKWRHINNAFKWWAICNSIFFGSIAAWLSYLGGPEMLLKPDILWPVGLAALALIPMFISLGRRYMPFVHLSEKVFTVLSLPDPANIDLVKSSKEQRTAEDAPEFGTFYFRY